MGIFPPYDAIQQVTITLREKKNLENQFKNFKNTKLGGNLS